MNNKQVKQNLINALTALLEVVKESDFIEANIKKDLVPFIKKDDGTMIDKAVFDIHAEILP